MLLEHGEQLLDALGRETGERGDELRVQRERTDARRAQHLEARRVQLRDSGQHRLARQARDRHRERLLDGDARTGPGERFRTQDRGLLEPLQHGDDQKRVPARLEEDATGQAIEIRRVHTPGAAAPDELPRLGRGEGLELHHLARQSSRASHVAPQANQRARGLLERCARAQHEQQRPPGDLRHRATQRLDAGAVRAVRLVHGQRYGLLLGERPQQRRQGGRHLGVVGGCARRDARERFGRQGREHGERAGLGRGAAWRTRQASAQQRPERAPGRVAVALERRGDRRHRAPEREAVHALGQKPGLARPRVTGDHKGLRAPL